MSASGGAAFGSPSPRGAGWGEGEETLRKPARLRTAEEVDYPERRKTKPHARRGAESLAVASRLPPHPGPLPQGEGTLHPALRRVEANVGFRRASSNRARPLAGGQVLNCLNLAGRRT